MTEVEAFGSPTIQAEKTAMPSPRPQLDPPGKPTAKEQEDGEKRQEVEIPQPDNPTVQLKHSASPNSPSQVPQSSRQKGIEKILNFCCFCQSDKEQHHEFQHAKKVQIPVRNQNEISTNEDNPAPVPNSPVQTTPPTRDPPFPGPEYPAPPVPEMHSTANTLSEESSLGPKDGLQSAHPPGGDILDTNSQISHPKVQPNDNELKGTPAPISETDSGPVPPRFGKSPIDLAQPNETQRKSQTPAQKQSYLQRVKAFMYPSETGREQVRDSGIIRGENEKVEVLQNVVTKRDDNYYKTPFKGEERGNEAYKEWAKDQFKKRKQVWDLIERATSEANTENTLESVWFVEYCKVSKGHPGPPWENMVIIGCEKKEVCELINKELENEETDTWFLRGFEVRAELRRKVVGCATRSVSSNIIRNPIGTPIFGQDLQGVPTLCGLSCHIRGSDTFLDSYFTIGGVLLINQKFFALTSAHPFQEKVSRAQEIHATSEVQLGSLSSYKFGNPAPDEGKPIGQVSDWALIELEPDYIKPNSLLLEGSTLRIPITGYLPTAKLTVGKVWVCSSRGPQLGVLVDSPTIIGMGKKVFETRGIRLVDELVDGDSGSWVVRDGQICGFIVSRTVGEPWAYMLPIEPVFEDIREYLESTWKGEVSKPQTWLGGAALKTTPQSSPPLKDLDSRPRAHINGRQGHIVSPQSDTAVSAEKPPDPAPTKTPASQPSIPAQSSVTDQQSSQPGARIVKSNSIEESALSGPRPAGKSEKEHSTIDPAAKEKSDENRMPKFAEGADLDSRSATDERDEEFRLIMARLPQVCYILVYPEDLGYQIDRISNLLQEGNGTGANRFAQDIVLEVIFFNDLMGQLIKPLTIPKTKEFDMWWGNSKWLENLRANNGLTKTRLILNILSEELKLIQRVLRIEKVVLSSVSSLPGLRRIIRKPLIQELASNNLRLRRLVEEGPLSFKQPDHRFSYERSAELLPDCTKYLELYKTLAPFPPSSFVGLPIPHSWLWHPHESIYEETQFATLKTSGTSKASDPTEAKILELLGWWELQSMKDASKDDMESLERSYVFVADRAFISDIHRIDGSLEPMVFQPLPKKLPQKLSTFNEVVKSYNQRSIPRQMILMMALGLSVGIIFLSPTPWYSSDSIHLWNKVRFLIGKEDSMGEVVFIPSLRPGEEGQLYAPKPILPELGHALLELALRGRLGARDIDHKRVDSLVRSGLIAVEMGVEYQDIVKTCLSQRYETSAGVKEIDESSTAFRLHVNEAIIMPLRKLWLESEPKMPSRLGKGKSVERSVTLEKAKSVVRLKRPVVKILPNERQKDSIEYERRGEGADYV